MVPNRCFVDTVCWIALLNQDDQLHESADNEYKSLMKSGTHFVTTTSILNETANALSDPRFRLRVVEFYRRLLMSARVEIVFVDPRLWSDGWQLYEQRPDKAWSLTDCISIVVMQEQGLKDVLTNDKHFQQAGFRALLREDR
ncbi:MAG: type II toxin-antitoxin system VapC family toxin [Candidatus Syntrophoarchaeum sp.]|nr:type II toxin-antitoxin system VapC family toxin [Candidatus Syntrophoarchaeum sp.]